MSPIHDEAAIVFGPPLGPATLTVGKLLENGQEPIVGLWPTTLPVGDAPGDRRAFRV
jgi:hypothetical protein